MVDSIRKQTSLCPSPQDGLVLRTWTEGPPWGHNQEAKVCFPASDSLQNSVDIKYHFYETIIGIIGVGV